MILSLLLGAVTVVVVAFLVVTWRQLDKLLQSSGEDTGHAARIAELERDNIRLQSRIEVLEAIAAGDSTS